jgi:hypothetical protein
MSKVLSSILALLGSCALGQKPERIEMFKYLASPGPFFGPTWTVEKEVALLLANWRTLRQLAA